MKSRFYVLFAPFLFITSMASQSAIAASDKTREDCKTLPALRAKLKEVEKKKANMDLLLKSNGIDPKVFGHFDNDLAKMKIDLNQLEKACKLLNAPTFTSNLHGYEVLPFYERMGKLFEKFGDLDDSRLQVDEHQLAKLADASSALLLNSVDLLGSLFETDSIKAAVAQLEYCRSLDNVMLLLMEILGIETKNIKDVDTLFMMIEVKMQELRAPQVMVGTHPNGTQFLATT